MRGSKGVAALLAACGLGSGCFSFAADRPVVMDVLMLVLGDALPEPVVLPRKAQKLEGQANVTASVAIGGLDGTYDVTLGPYGRFAGTAKVVGKKGAKLVVKDSPELLAAVQGIVLDTLGVDVTVSGAKGKVVGKQTTGGVNKRYKGKIKFKGTVASGLSAGARVKGKITTSGDLEAPQI
ncbi:MAG TPA: hypothetical protein VNO26_15745 [Candidatus Limnocylindria bacterium]|nr:hypothetical protein [Candidatus Limnocylindria bacterium]